MMRLALLAALAVGCASLEPIVVLQHPETKQTVACQRVAGGSWATPGQQVENCVRAHEAAGYVRTGN